MRRNVAGLCAVSLLFFASAFAETVTLKSGKTVEGAVLEKTADSLKIEVAGIPVTYYLDEIEALDGKKIETPAAQPSGTPANAAGQKVVVEFLNSEYMKAPNAEENIAIDDTASVEDMLKKTNYYYANREHDKAIALCEAALAKTTDKELTARIYFSLSSNYLEKGIEPYQKSKDDSYYKKSIEYAKKHLEVFPSSWQALANMGAVYLNMRDWAQAASYYEQAAQCLDEGDPHHAELLSMRNVAEAMGKKELAENPSLAQ